MFEPERKRAAPLIARSHQQPSVRIFPQDVILGRRDADPCRAMVLLDPRRMEDQRSTFRLHLEEISVFGSLQRLQGLNDMHRAARLDLTNAAISTARIEVTHPDARASLDLDAQTKARRRGDRGEKTEFERRRAFR